jgi:hypothetical protein
MSQLVSLVGTNVNVFIKILADSEFNDLKKTMSVRRVCADIKFRISAKNVWKVV